MPGSYAHINRRHGRHNVRMEVRSAWAHLGLGLRRITPHRLSLLLQSKLGRGSTFSVHRSPDETTAIRVPGPTS